VPEVDFYVLGEPGDAGVLRVACRVTEKAWSQGLTVFVLARSAEQAAAFDDLLWTWRQDSFVPHERWDGAGTAGARVTIGATASPPRIPDLLVNLGAAVPAWFRECTRIAEVVGADDGPKADGRRRYREYRSAGVELRTHEVRP
jgi:DNA polymerase IIIc chi subunit